MPLSLHTLHVESRSVVAGDLGVSSTGMDKKELLVMPLDYNDPDILK